jgi:molybdenum cofactor cytidylyltransferase
VTIAAILLAAGESTRMGRLKQLLPWAGTPLIAWQVGQLREAGADQIVVVLGHEAEQVRGAVPAEARVVLNAAYRQGRATSLRAGAEALAGNAGGGGDMGGRSPSEVEAVLILSADQPRPAWLTRALIERWRADRPLVVSPRFERGYGHPILLDGSLLPELREVSDETLGLRGVIDRHIAQARSVSVGNQSLDVDLNTPGDYEAALAAFERGEWAEGVKSSSR